MNDPTAELRPQEPWHRWRTHLHRKQSRFPAEQRQRLRFREQDQAAHRSNEEAAIDSMAAFDCAVGILVPNLKIRTCFTWSEVVCVKMVDLATAYLNPSPQVITHAERLPDLLLTRTQNPDPKPATQSPNKAWALNRRLTVEARSTIVISYLDGVRQQALADHYQVSLSSIKRLVRASRSEK